VKYLYEWVWLGTGVLLIRWIECRCCHCSGVLLIYRCIWVQVLLSLFRCAVDKVDWVQVLSLFRCAADIQVYLSAGVVIVQVFSYTRKKSLQADDLCLDVSSLGGAVKLYQCHGLGGNQLWQYNHDVRCLIVWYYITQSANRATSVSWTDVVKGDWTRLCLLA